MKHTQKALFYVYAGLLLLAAGCTQHHINIVPEPAQMKLLSGHFILAKNTPLVFRNVDESSPAVSYIKECFATRFGVNGTAAADNTDKAVTFAIAKSANAALHDEGYELQVSEDGITVIANHEAGLVNALQTLYQLAPANITEKHPATVTIPAVAITDYPRFEWRGSMLDVSRHFFDVNYVKKHLDVMALYKLNKFHWHLTDDHGWRIEIDKYPKLTEIGAWRADRSNVTWKEAEPPKEGEPSTYGGFYTKAQIRDIVAYAAQRNIEVIPEIEIPGHCSEILASYPEFACDDYPYVVEVRGYWPPKAILCGGNDNVMKFLKDVIDEVAELFPSEYIHIGGDEALKDNWKVCPKCQQRIKKLKLNNEEELQSWMICEIEKHVMAKGKKIIGWDEILEGGVTPSATVMYWRSWVGDSVIVEAIRHGNHVVMTPNSHCYIDYYQADPNTETQVAIGGYVPIEKVYAFEPVPAGLTDKEAAFIKGGQVNLWAEFLYTPKNVEYMLLPRLLALSEVVWSPKESRNWEQFVQKLPAQKQRLGALGYTYSDKVGLIRDEPAATE